MRTVQNACFGFRLRIPDSLDLVSWKHARIKKNWRALYQARDDELPRKTDAGKFLFTATRYARESRALVEARIEVSVFRIARGADFREQLLSNLAREGRQVYREGLWNLGGVRFRRLDEPDGSSRRRFAWAPFRDPYWLYVHLAARRPPLARALYDIVEGIVWTAPWPGGAR